MMQDFKYDDLPFVGLNGIITKPNNKRYIIKSFLDNLSFIPKRKN
jgi:hypothetical protein